MLDARLIAFDAAEDLTPHRMAFKDAIAELSDLWLHAFYGTIVDTISRDGELEVSVRRYEPQDARPGAAVVYMHGGGWVLGDVDTADRFARRLASDLRVVVISVDYRLAPEHPFPAAFHDCRAVAAAAREEFTWCALAGDSAGGSLALSVALAAPPDRGFDAQLLIYPCVDGHMRSASYEQFAEGYGLTRADMTYYWDAYGADHPRDDALLSPLASEHFSHLPPTVIASAEFDVLRDEAHDLAGRLAADGVPVALVPFPSLPHGFIDTVDRVPAAKRAVATLLTVFESMSDQLSAVERSGARGERA